MGVLDVKKIDGKSRAKFIRYLLDDIKALEIMLEKGLIEDDIVRIGAEQELCLVDRNWRPTKNATDILDALKDPHFTYEIARYNLEINLDPLELKDNCFTQMEEQLRTLLKNAMITADTFDTQVLLTGILPTIDLNELSMGFMSPSIRYELLNEAIKQIRKKDFELHIRGVDELSLNHDSVLFEACNSSFQLHLQIAPNDFAASYNWAQAISGPILGIAANSPLLLGRELWSETRIALFQQSTDTRSSTYSLRDKQARVTFGSAWVKDSIINIYKDDISRYEIIMNTAIEKNSLKELRSGNIPKLKALNLHNGTIYRWNRPCYGISDNKPHIRIENRYIPAGPTVLDEMANFAFWAGLMMARPTKFDDMPNQMDFLDIKDNFFMAARNGSNSVMHWMGATIPTRDLVTKELLPIAYKGLEKAGIDRADIERLLGVIKKRAKGFNGAEWNIRNYRSLKKKVKQDDALVTLTKSIYENQQTGLPVADWPMFEIKKGFEIEQNAFLVKHLMSSRLFIVNENDLADMATSIMQWKNIHHVPVVDDNHELCGLLTWSHMNAHIKEKSDTTDIKVSDIMVDHVIKVDPNTKIKKAIQLMQKHQIGCLPVVDEYRLAGIITKKDMVGQWDD
ncbi:MAG: CBS domain-containing protein [Maribacter sp.]|nr:CBS domain-containing protein [Maribacter sp.]